MHPDRLHVEVVAVLAGQTVHIALEVPPGTTLRNAIERARLADHLDAALLARCRYGVFGRERPLDSLLADGDRVELYWPLLDDPKAIRRRRAAAQGRGTRRPGA